MEHYLKRLCDLRLETNEKTQESNFATLVAKCAEFTEQPDSSANVQQTLVHEFVRISFKIINHKMDISTVVNLFDVLRFFQEDLERLTSHVVLSNGFIKYLGHYLSRFKTENSGVFLYDEAPVVFDYATFVLSEATDLTQDSDEFQATLQLLIEASETASSCSAYGPCQGKKASFCMSLISTIIECFHFNKLQINTKSMKSGIKRLISTEISFRENSTSGSKTQCSDYFDDYETQYHFYHSLYLMFSQKLNHSIISRNVKDLYFPLVHPRVQDFITNCDKYFCRHENECAPSNIRETIDKFFVPFFQRHVRLINNHSNAEQQVTNDDKAIASYILNSVEFIKKVPVQSKIGDIRIEDVEKYRYFKKAKSGKISDQKTIHFGAHTLQSDDIEPKDKIRLSYIDLYEIYCKSCNPEVLNRLGRKVSKRTLRVTCIFKQEIPGNDVLNDVFDMENVHEQYAGIHIYLDSKSKSRLEALCHNLQKKLSSVFERTNQNYDVIDKHAIRKKKSKTPKKKAEQPTTAEMLKLQIKSLARSATSLFINTQPESQSQGSDLNGSVHDESMNAFEDEIMKAGKVGEITPNLKGSTRKSKIGSGKKKSSSSKSKKISKVKVPKSVEKKVSKNSRKRRVELKGKRAQQRNQGNNIEVSANMKADADKSTKKTALKSLGATSISSTKKTESKVPKSHRLVSDNEYNSSIFSDSDDDLTRVDTKKARGRVIPETAPEDDFGHLTDENTYTEAESEDEIVKKTASTGNKRKMQRFTKSNSSNGLKPKARKKAAVKVNSKRQNRPAIKATTATSRPPRAKKSIVEQNSCDEGQDEILSIVDSIISSGEESDIFKEDDSEFSENDYEIDEKETRKIGKSRTADKRKSKSLTPFKTKTARKTKVRRVRPKITKKKPIPYTSESDDNNCEGADDTDRSLKLLTNTISKFNKESTEKDDMFVSKANKVVNKKMVKYHQKLQLSLNAKLDSLATKSNEGQLLKTKFTKMKKQADTLSKELSLTITEIQATQAEYAEKQREAEKLANDVKRHAVACKRKFVHYCDALRKKQKTDFDSYVASKNRKKQKFMQKMMNMIESSI